MRLIDADNVVAYLHEQGRLEPDDLALVQELAGGVSNIVLHVSSRDCREDWVIKQAREQLRVAEPWFCSVERIWREADVLRVCHKLLHEYGLRFSLDRPETDELYVATPRLVFEDRENYVFGMTAVNHFAPWKTELLAGKTRPALARAAGRMLAALHAGSWRDEQLARQLEDRQYFEQLRVDPYYRQLARNDDSLRDPIDRLMTSLESNACGLVHGDFSPKNLLPDYNRLVLVDFEVGHFGDVAFDVGFFLSHLALKAFRAAPDWQPMLALIRDFWRAYPSGLGDHLTTDEIAGIESRALLHLAGCGLARIDGKSPVEYLDATELRTHVRQFFRQMLFWPLPKFSEWEPSLIASLTSVPA